MFSIKLTVSWCCFLLAAHTHTHTHTHTPTHTLTGGRFGLVYSQQPTRDHVVKLEANQGIMITREGGGINGERKGGRTMEKGETG